MDTIVFAIIAVVLIYRLYSILGRDDTPIPQQASNTSSEPRANKQPDKLELLLRRHNIPLFLKPAFAAILLKDSTFDFKHFLSGAESAYSMIVTHAFEHHWDEISDYIAEEVLKQLQKTLSSKQKVRVKVSDASIVDAEFKNPTGFITVQFKSKLQTRTATKERLEDWLFMRDLEQDNPTWVLHKIVPFH